MVIFPLVDVQNHASPRSPSVVSYRHSFLPSAVLVPVSSALPATSTHARTHDAHTYARRHACQSWGMRDRERERERSSLPPRRSPEVIRSRDCGSSKWIYRPRICVNPGVTRNRKSGSRRAGFRRNDADVVDKSVPKGCCKLSGRERLLKNERSERARMRSLKILRI